MSLASRRGFALFAALVVLVVVSGVLLDAALRARTERRQAWIRISSLRAQAAARAGLSHAVSRYRALQGRTLLLIPGDPAIAAAWNRVDRWVADLEDVPLRDSARYSVSARDVGTALPVNLATEEELTRLFLALGANSHAATVAAQSILDWRDADGMPRPLGAEAAHYRARGSEGIPRNGPLLSLSEVRGVHGMETLYEVAEPYLTVLGAVVNLNAAPEPVLRALPGMTDEAVALVLRHQSSGTLLKHLVELEPGLSSAGREVLLRNFEMLARRTTFEAAAVEVLVTGRSRTSSLERVVHAVIARNDSTVEVVWKTEP